MKKEYDTFVLRGDKLPDGQECRITIRDLSPGKYTFKVKATDKAGNSTLYPAQLIFEIDSPLYKQIWFIRCRFITWWTIRWSFIRSCCRYSFII